MSRTTFPPDLDPVVSMGADPIHQRTRPWPLSEALELAATVEPPAADPRLRSLAIRGLGVRRRKFQDWYRRAWWGWIASRMVGGRLNSGRSEEVEEVVGESMPVGSSPTIFVGAHVGPAGAARYLLAQGVDRLFCVAATPMAVGHEEVHNVKSEFHRKTAPLAMLSALESRRSVYFAADGRHGPDVADARFLKHRVTIRTQLPQLSGRVQIPARIAFATWRGRQIGLHLADLPPIETSDLGSSLSRWFKSYVAEIEAVGRADPANLRLVGGFWRQGAGGVFDD
jgi:hypothetical protein